MPAEEVNNSKRVSNGCLTNLCVFMYEPRVYLNFVIIEIDLKSILVNRKKTVLLELLAVAIVSNKSIRKARVVALSMLSCGWVDMVQKALSLTSSDLIVLLPAESRHGYKHAIVTILFFPFLPLSFLLFLSPSQGNVATLLLSPELCVDTSHWSR